MTTVIGVRFREVGKIYYFDPGELEFKIGDHVIVDTVRGTEFGTVMIPNRQVEDEEIVQPLKVVRRMATEDDVERVKANREKEADAFKVCKEKIREHGLEMKLISAEYTFDNAKILFYFTADGRVDFRELVKDLASVFKIRIELRQVGVRDETKIMGGLGGCGRPLCCASYLSDFVPVSIRMAKEQNLSLNPQKISGVCGRLMCCLKNEAETYEDLNTRLPKEGGKVVTKDGREGIAESVNVLRERVRVLFTDEQGNREAVEFPASELQFTPRRKQKAAEQKISVKAEEMDETEETLKELIEEADAETDPELKELEMAEIRDEDSDTSESENSDNENRANRPNRRRRNRNRRNYQNHHNDKGGHNDGNQNGNENGGEQGNSDNHRHHNNHGNENRQNGDDVTQNSKSVTEHKHNGANRRFRKRRPKTNSES